jgi:DNA/RNA-binding domain of Phe-tRNA-synthetase-like protein
MNAASNPVLPASATKLTLRTSGPRAWLLSDATGADVGGITYQHAPDGLHCRGWVFRDGTRHDVGEPTAQLAMTARAIKSAHLSCTRDGCKS